MNAYQRRRSGAAGSEPIGGKGAAYQLRCAPLPIPDASAYTVVAYARARQVG